MFMCRRNPPGNPPMDPSGAIVRSVALRMIRRLADQPELVRPLSSVVEMVDHDEADLALDDIGMVIKFSRFPVLRSEYEDLRRAAQQLDSLDSLTDTGVEQLVVEG
ncbi:conserved protein of unknown function [Streptomyces sp. KY75]|nr:hypothetical protein STIB_38860 [Streptomyces sp. IB2014 011-1]RDV49889.1 hypothetical protein DDV98_22585 [Streptomyces sp. IB2014 011-12]CAD5961866.1 conserved protein of unknown function [Streptomyces sp. KY75]CAD5979682.1 conserved protein of unknown function [Streptomyces sp. KY70]